MRVKKLLKVVAYSLFGFVVFILLLAGVTQTQFFRDRLRSYALSRLDSLLAAEVHLGTVTGNLISGFSIDHFSIEVRDEFLITAERLDLRYDLFEIPGKTISVDNLTIVRPAITLLRGRDSVWNFERMIRPAPEDTTTSGPFDWTIRLKSLKIEDASFVLVDSASLMSPDHPVDDPYYVEYHNVALKNLTLVTSLTISRDEKRAVISTFMFISDKPDFELRQLTGDFRVTGKDASVRDMILETAVSDIRLDAEMKDFSLLGGIELEQLQKKPVTLSFHAQAIDLNELKRFIPQIGFLGSKVSLDLNARGEFGELGIKSLDLKSGETEFHITGTLFNLHTPDDLYLNTRFVRSRVYWPDVHAILPVFDLPDFQALGRSKLDLTFVGKPLDFRSQFTLETDAGTVRTDGTLKIGGPERLRYSCQVDYRELNLAAITTTNDLVSRLNGALHIEGRGVSLDNLNAALDVGLDSSEFAGRHVGTTRFRIEGAEGRFSGKGTLAVESMRAELSGSLDRHEKNIPAFSLTGSASSLNMRQLLRDPSAESDLNVGITAHGRGLTWGSLNGEFTLDFLPSRYRDYGIDSSTVHIAIDQQNPLRKRVALTSDIADFSLNGAFDTEYMKDLITFELLNLRKAVAEKFASLDSTFGSTIDYKALTALERKLAAPHDNLNAAFSLQVKNLEPISIATGNRRFNGVGVLTGTMQGSYRDLFLSARLGVDDFYYGNADSGILVHDGVATLDVSGLKPVAPLKDLGIRFMVEAGNMHINRSEFDSLRTTFKYEQEYSSYTVAGLYNRDARMVVKGFSSISGDYLLFTLNNLELGYKGFGWQADGGATIGFGPRGVRVSKLTMRRDSGVVSVSGEIIRGASVTGVIAATNINLEDINYFLAREELGTKQEAFTGLASLDLSAAGTMQHPAYSASLTARRVSFRGVPLGNINGTFKYENQSLAVLLSVMNSQSIRPNLAVTGTIPMNLSLAGPESSHVEIPMNLHVQSDGIQIGILDPILPTFNQLNGVMKCDVTVVGSPGRPDYEGKLSIDSCSFLFVPNLVSYTFGGQFQLHGDRVQVIDAAVQSKPSDDQFKRAGLMKLAGSFALRDFKPSDFNLTLNGGLLLVREATRKSSLSVYGNLFIETGVSGLRYTGDIAQSQLRGYILVKNSSLIFPPTQQAANDELSNTVPVRIIDDTTTVTVSQPRPLADRYFGMEGETGEATPHAEQLPTKSFVNGIRYDLDIECAGGNTEIRMIFNSATSEELVANINGKFSISEDGKRWVGTMFIDRAYYRFIKQFNAGGTIKYSGDYLNPELDITATYEGFRTSVDSTSSSRPEKVVVSMKITGTRLAPRLDWAMTIDDVDYYSYKGTTSSDVQTDALAFILAGTFPLSRSQANDLAVDLGPTARSSLFTGAGSLLTSALSDFLRRETGFIYSIELSYGTQSSFGEAADIRISGGVGRGIWRYGGRILNDPFSNANISLLYSLGDIFERPSLRNFMFELERKVETNIIGETSDKKQVNSARLFYRFSF